MLAMTHEDADRTRRQREHFDFINAVNSMAVSFSKELAELIQDVLANSNSQVRIRPPHDSKIQCGFDDCVYCALREGLQDNLKTLRSTVLACLASSVNGPRDL